MVIYIHWVEQIVRINEVRAPLPQLVVPKPLVELEVVADWLLALPSRGRLRPFASGSVWRQLVPVPAKRPVMVSCTLAGSALSMAKGINMLHAHGAFVQLRRSSL